VSAALLAELRDLGVRFVHHGGRLRLEAPVGVLTPGLRQRLHRERAALRETLASENPGDWAETGSVVETRERLGAVLISSPRFGEVWVVLDPCAVAELGAEEARREVPRPVLLAAELARIRGKSEGTVRGVLETARAFPGARVLQ
jgi:hypothetical protein